MSATAALRAFCEDEDLFGAAWGQRSQTRVSLQGAEWCLCESVDVRINCEMQDHALWSLSAPVPRDLSLNQLRVQAHWASWTWEMQQNFSVKKTGVCPSAFLVLEAVSPKPLLAWMAFSLFPEKLTRQKQQIQACEHMNILTNVPSLQVYETMLVGFKCTFM